MKCHNKSTLVAHPFLPFCDTEAMVADAILYLQQNEPVGGYYVGFSGGKDSICTIELCKLAGVAFTAYYSCTRIEPPEVVRFIREHYPEVIFLMPDVTFWDAIRKKSPPLRVQRWCCDVLKKDPGKKIDNPFRVMGIRAEESSKRASRPRTDRIKRYKQNVFKPIFYWTEYHVWDFIEKRGMAYPLLYDEGFHRIGCVICPFIMGKSPGKTKQRELSMRRWPGMWKAFENVCRSWFEVMRDEELRPGQNHKNFDEYYRSYLLGFEDVPKVVQFARPAMTAKAI